MDWLPALFGTVWVPSAIVAEQAEGQQRGYDVPAPDTYSWVQVVEPGSVPSEWLSLSLGRGELATLSLALQHPEHVVLLDDALARRIAQAADLEVWGTLRILLEARSTGMTERIVPHVDALAATGMWLSADIRGRVLSLAGER